MLILHCANTVLLVCYWTVRYSDVAHYSTVYECYVCVLLVDIGVHEWALYHGPRFSVMQHGPNKSIRPEHGHCNVFVFHSIQVR